MRLGIILNIIIFRNVILTMNKKSTTEIMTKKKQEKKRKIWNLKNGPFPVVLHS